MTYKIEFKKSAVKELRRIPDNTARRIFAAIQKLSANPRAGDAKQLVGSSSWRLRVGDYRVIYTVYDKRLIIEIVRIRHRKDVYR